METYNALIGTKVKEMTIQEMFNTAYDIASREGSCKVWNYDFLAGVKKRQSILIKKAETLSFCFFYSSIL